MTNRFRCLWKVFPLRGLRETTRREREREREKERERREVYCNSWAHKNGNSSPSAVMPVTMAVPMAVLKVVGVYFSQCLCVWKLQPNTWYLRTWYIASAYCRCSTKAGYVVVWFHQPIDTYLVARKSSELTALPITQCS